MPQLVVGDEAGRLSEGLSLTLTSCWRHAKVLLLGDPFQFGPVSSTINANFDRTTGYGDIRISYRDIFGPQRAVSHLSRMHHADVLDMYLTKSRRSEGISQMFAVHNFYSGRIELVHPKNTRHTAVTRKAFAELFDCESLSSDSYFLDLSGANEQKPGTTYYNMESAYLVISLLRWIALQNFANVQDQRDSIPQKEIRKATIMVITPYKEQCARLRMLLNSMSNFEICKALVNIRLVDKSAGHQATIVIYDLVRPTGVGFTGETPRHNVATTRS
ncbi:hypothetical protein E4U41_001600 [Claviceps citrina]|nr:hypothetical protein E4U41_001600 [Claviceps citrina]